MKLPVPLEHIHPGIYPHYWEEVFHKVGSLLRYVFSILNKICKVSLHQIIRFKDEKPGVKGRRLVKFMPVTKLYGNLIHPTLWISLTFGDIMYICAYRGFLILQHLHRQRSDFEDKRPGVREREAEDWPAWECQLTSACNPQ